LTATQRIAFSVALVFGLCWSTCLAVLGLFALDASHRGPLNGPLFVALGVGALAAGNFVFMELVANRLVPQSRRRMADSLEFAAAVAALLSILLSLMLWYDGSTQ